MFYVGQKVVCVDAYGATGLASDAVYTVSEIMIEPAFDAQGLNFAELPPRSAYGEFYSYRATRFRPIQERKTDIGFAHEILRKVTKKAPADQRKFETASAVGS